MSRYCGEKNVAPILEAAATWRDRCLLSDGSMFTDKNLWSLEGLLALDRHFVQNPEEGEGNFLDKLLHQVSPTDGAVKQLTAEMMWVILLSPSNILPPRKRETVSTIWNWSNEPLPQGAQRWLTDEVLAGVGSGGPGFNNHRWRELVFLINAVMAFKRLRQMSRSDLVADPWKFGEWLQSIAGAAVRQLRHMLLFLLFPDTFERSFARGDRVAVALAFSGLSEQVIDAQTPLELDRTLLRVRKELETEYGTRNLDFYNPPLRSRWRPVDFATATQEVTAAHVRQAFADIDRDGVTPGAESTGYDLLEAGKRYPPKLVVSLAVRHASGAELDRAGFAGGEDSATHRLLKRLGFQIVPKGNAPIAREPEVADDDEYDIDDELDDLFISRERFLSMVARLKMKKNLILQGPPGVGKTYFATHLARALILSKDSGRIGMVQFHPTYAYEDFVQGYRPTGTGFSLRNGVFYEFCRKAQRDPGNGYVFIIDEINRANLGKVLGELMMLIESDKRGEKWAIPLAYSSGSDDRFFVPSNLHLLGLMNTADRSLAMVDYALRRRFAFETLSPAFGNEEFGHFLKESGASEALIRRIVNGMQQLNDEIAQDGANLGPGYRIGHSYFCAGIETGGATEDWYKDVIRSEIVPLLEEYWFDDPPKAKAWERRLLGE